MGYPVRTPHVRRVAVPFDDETFGDVRARAVAAGTSFAEQARQLVEYGLESVRAAEETDSRGGV
jgi:hypothetical protein